MAKWRGQDSEGGTYYHRVSTVYDLPIGMSLIRRYKFLEYLPISPTYKRQNPKDNDSESWDEQNNYNHVAKSDANTAV